MAASSDRELQRLLNKDPTVWTVSEVGMWLSAVGLEAYKIQFLSEGISGTELFELDTDDLPVLGITSSGQQKRFWAELRNLKNKPKLSRSPSARTTGSSDSSGSGIATSGATSSSSSSSAAASASASSAAELAVKFVYRGKSYKRMVPVDSSVSEVRHIAKRLFGKTVSLNFRDGDGDTIPLRRDADWRYAKKATGDRLMTLNCSRRTRTTQAKRSETEALKHLKDPVIIIDANGVINFFNHAAEQFFGWPASSIIGSKVNMLMPDDFAENHDRYMQNYLTTGVAKIIGKGRQVRALLRNGKSVDIFLTVRETSTRKGRHFVGTIQESSADVVQVDQTSHFTILQSILDPAVVISDKGIVQYLNPAACTLFGYSPTQVVGKNVKMLMQGKDKREHDEYIRRYLETGQATVLGKGREVVGVNSRGELIPIHLSVTEQKLSNQSIFTGMCREIQRRDDSAVETETVLAKTRTVLEDLLVASVVINDAGIIQYLNPACEDLLSIRLTDAIGRNVAILMPEEHARHHDEYLRKWRETGVENVFGIGRSLIAKNFSTGAAIPVRLSVSKRLDETKRYICIGALIPE